MDNSAIHNHPNRDQALEQMRLALEEKHTVPMGYIGGSLCLAFRQLMIVSLQNENLTDEERLATARLYLQNKKPTHAFYNLAKSIVEAA